MWEIDLWQLLYWFVVILVILGSISLIAYLLAKLQISGWLQPGYRFLFASGIVIPAVALVHWYLLGKPPAVLSYDNITPLQLLFGFSLASLFPLSAISYLLFQYESRKRLLAADFWKLGIDIREATPENEQETTKELEDMDVRDYRKHIDDMDQKRHVSMNYIALSIPALLVTLIGISLFPLGHKNAWSSLIIIPKDENILQALRFGFLGAYIYALQLVYRRYTTLDLQPSVYINCALTIIAGIAFNFVAFKAITEIAANPPAQTSSVISANGFTGPGDFAGANVITTTSAISIVNTITGTSTITTTSTVTTTIPESNQVTHAAGGIAGGILAIIAFSLGYFPSLAIRWFNRIAHVALGVVQRRSDSLLLGVIDGISQLHETRLLDEGIDNLQNLAAARFDELLLNTPFSAQQAVDWIDQASLYLYLDTSEIESFRRAGVRGFTDLEDSWRCYYREPFTKPEKEFDQERKERGLLLQSLPERLDQLYRATQQGPNVVYIKKYWERTHVSRLNRWDWKLVTAFFIDIGKEKPSALTATVGVSSSPLFMKLQDAGVWKAEAIWSRDGETERMMGKDDWVMAQIGKARVARQLGKIKIADTAYHKAIHKAPYRDDIRNELAWFYVQECNLDPETLATKLKETKAPDINPVITSADNVTFTVGQLGSFTVTATGCPLPKLVKTSGDLPSNVRFDPQVGSLSGVPAADTAGIYNLSFQASNSVGTDAMQNFTLTVKA